MANLLIDGGALGTAKGDGIVATLDNVLCMAFLLSNRRTCDVLYHIVVITQPGWPSSLPQRQHS